MGKGQITEAQIREAMAKQFRSLHRGDSGTTSPGRSNIVFHGTKFCDTVPPEKVWGNHVSFEFALVLARAAVERRASRSALPGSVGLGRCEQSGRQANDTNRA